MDVSEIKELLIHDDIDTIREMLAQNDTTYLEGFLNLFYDNQTEEQLQQEYNERELGENLELDFESWSKSELAEFLVDRGIYEDIDTALLTDRSDLISECKDEW